MRRVLLVAFGIFAVLWVYFYAKAALGRELPREDPTEVIP